MVLIFVEAQPKTVMYTVSSTIQKRKHPKKEERNNFVTRYFCLILISASTSFHFRNLLTLHACICTYLPGTFSVPNQPTSNVKIRISLGKVLCICSCFICIPFLPEKKSEQLQFIFFYTIQDFAFLQLKLFWVIFLSQGKATNDLLVQDTEITHWCLI